LTSAVGCADAKTPTIQLTVFDKDAGLHDWVLKWKMFKMTQEPSLQRVADGARFMKERAMLRQGFAVVIGFAIWSAIWLACNELLVELHALPHSGNTPIQEAAPLLALLVSAAIASLAAGYATAMVNASASTRPVLVLGALLVIVGVAVQSNFLDLMPLWYHVAFLALLLPVCLVGAKLYRH
jgi:hypothetical protein